MTSGAGAVDPTGLGWPRRLGRFLLLAPLSRGGYGVIHVAAEGSLDGALRLCAVKTIAPELSADLQALQRFVDEAKVLISLSHPSLAQVYEVSVDGTPWVAMELVRGRDLGELSDAARAMNKPIELGVVCTVLSAILDAIGYAHNAKTVDGKSIGLVHRDLAPDNVRLSWEGDVKVLDFGTALAAGRSARTLEGHVLGHPSYMAPEQCRGETVDPRADLFTIGVIAWELLTGQRFAVLPPERHIVALAAGAVSVDRATVYREDCPEELADWVAGLLALDRDARPVSASVARRALSDMAARWGLRLEREVVSNALLRLFPTARADDDDVLRGWVDAARGKPVPPSDPPRLRERRTEPMRLGDNDSLLPGTRYRIGARLGVGGMGEVFAAEHVDLGRSVAVKVLHREQSDNPAVAQRFRLEARAIAALSHPNLVHVYDLGETLDGRLFYAMERLYGETLRDRLRRAREESGSARLDVETSVSIAEQVARGLAAAHKVSVVHRDIKPENIFLCRDGSVKVLDFGVAKTTNTAILQGVSEHATRAGEYLGTPAYASPEQCFGENIDTRTDLYALGVVLYECLTGEELFVGAAPHECVARHLIEVPRRVTAVVPEAKVPESLADLVAKCLEKKIADRPPSAEWLVDALAKTLSPDARPVTSEIPPGRQGVFFSRKAIGLAGAMFVVVAVALFAAQKTARTPVDTRTINRDAQVAIQTSGVITGAVSADVVSADVVSADVVSADVVSADVVTADVVAAHGSRARRRSVYSQALQAFREGRNEQAHALAEEAVAQGRNNLDARLLLGRILNAQGRRADAVRQWEMVRSRDPSNAEAVRLLRMVGAVP